MIPAPTMIAFLEARRAGLFRRGEIWRNVVAGVIVGVVALPLAMAFAIASGAKPEQGLYTAIVAGLATSVLGGTRVQISGPTGAFIAVLAGITAEYGVAGLQAATLMAGAMLLVLANLTLGLLISTKAQTQFQAMQMTFFVFLPSILLSGFMFPFAGMPRVVQWIAEVLPLTHFLRLIRGIMLRGGTLLELWPSVLALVAFTAVMMTAAIRRFRKRLD